MKYVYLAGLAHSGSTFFSRVLNEHPEIFVAGELLNTHKSLKERTNDCQCLKARDRDSCEFWNGVYEEFTARGGDPDTVGRLHSDNRLDWVLSCCAGLCPSVSEEFCSENYKLLSILRNRSGRDIILDTSKRPWRLLALLPLEKQEDVTFHVLHLYKGVRNQLGSRMRRGYNFWHSLFLKYIRKNMLYPLFFGSRKYKRIQFEEFVSQPEEVISSVFNWLEVAEVDPYSREERQPFHHISGGGGDTIFGDLRPDEEQLKKTYEFTLPQELALNTFRHLKAISRELNCLP